MSCCSCFFFDFYLIFFFLGFLVGIHEVVEILHASFNFTHGIVEVFAEACIGQAAQKEPRHVDEAPKATAVDQEGATDEDGHWDVAVDCIEPKGGVLWLLWSHVERHEGQDRRRAEVQDADDVVREELIHAPIEGQNPWEEQVAESTVELQHHEGQ